MAGQKPGGLLPDFAPAANVSGAAPIVGMRDARFPCQP